MTQCAAHSWWNVSGDRSTSLHCRSADATRSSARRRRVSGDPRPIAVCQPALRRVAGSPTSSRRPGRSWITHARSAPSTTPSHARRDAATRIATNGPSLFMATFISGTRWRRWTDSSSSTRTVSSQNRSTTSGSSCARIRSTSATTIPRNVPVARWPHGSRRHQHLGMGRRRARLDRPARHEGGLAARQSADARRCGSTSRLARHVTRPASNSVRRPRRVA